MCSKILPLILLILLLALPLEAAHLHKEKVYQEAWCSQRHGIVEYVLDDGSRVDCLTDEYAVEFEFASKWAEAVGQALYYAYHTNHKAGIVLIVESPSDERYLKRLLPICDEHGIRVWIITPGDISNHNLD